MPGVVQVRQRHLERMETSAQAACVRQPVRRRDGCERAHDHAGVGAPLVDGRERMGRRLHCRRRRSERRSRHRQERPAEMCDRVDSGSQPCEARGAPPGPSSCRSRGLVRARPEVLGRIGHGVQEAERELDTAHTVGEAVVELLDHRRATGAHPLDDGQLPQRPGRIERRHRDRLRQVQHVAHAAGTGNADPTEVVPEVHVLDRHPTGRAQPEPRPDDPRAEPRDQMRGPFDPGRQAVPVGRTVEERHRGDRRAQKWVALDLPQDRVRRAESVAGEIHVGILVRCPFPWQGRRSPLRGQVRERDADHLRARSYRTLLSGQGIAREELVVELERECRWLCRAARDRGARPLLISTRDRAEARTATSCSAAAPPGSVKSHLRTRRVISTLDSSGARPVAGNTRQS